MKGGASPNPGGRPRRLAEIEKMLDAEHRTVENMREVFARLKALALGEVVRVPDPDSEDGTATIELRSDPAFMKLYLDRTLGPVRELASEEDIARMMQDAPPEVVEWWRRLPTPPS